MEFDVRRWAGAVLGTLAVIAVVAVNVAQGDIVAAAIVFLVLGLLLWWSWPGRVGSHVGHAAAQETAGDDDVIVYWRPG